MTERCVAHLDMDAFYVSVELRRHPELRGRPVMVAGSGPRAVVTTASYEARRFGIGSAMPAARARRLCPDVVSLWPDFTHYREVSSEIMAIVRRHVPQVEVIGLDEVYLDLTGLPAPHACMRRIVAEIGAVTGLGCSVGIGPSKLVAKVASDAEKPRGFLVLSGAGARARFAQSPPSLVPGIGPRTAERLGDMGIDTLEKLAAARVEVLAARFGARLGPDLIRRARFEDRTQVTGVRKVVSESREVTFDTDIADPALLKAQLERLVERLSAALVGQGRAGRTIGIKIRLSDFSTYTRSRTVAAPVAEREQVGPVAGALLAEFTAERPGRAVRLIGVRVANLHAREASGVGQLSLGPV